MLLLVANSFIISTVYLTGCTSELEKSLYTGENKWFGLKKKYYEADIVSGNDVWEVKPITGKDPKPQLELYKKIGGLKLGRQLGTIRGVRVYDNIKMDITFPRHGEARYSLYLQGKNGTKIALTTVGAALAIAKGLVKSIPAGRRLAPAF
jgi:hypothetical protein